MSAEQIVDITIIGGGPTGLAAAYYGGHRDASVRIVESLEQLGGQVSAVYPEKHIFDVAGYPKVNGQELIDRLTEQAMQYSPDVRLGEVVETIEHRATRDPPAHGRRRDAAYTDDDHHRRAWRVQPAQARPSRPRPLGGQRPALLRARRMYSRPPGGAGGRRRLGAGLGDGPAGHGRAADPADPPPRPVPRAGVVGQRGAAGWPKRAASDPHPVRGAGRRPATATSQQITVENTETGELAENPVDELVTLLGFVSHLGAIANWGLEFENKRQIAVTRVMETNLPGVYAAGDVAGYEGKITLISIGFGEAATAANHAVAHIRGEKVQPKYSTE